MMENFQPPAISNQLPSMFSVIMSLTALLYSDVNKFEILRFDAKTYKQRNVLENLA